MNTSLRMCVVACAVSFVGCANTGANYIPIIDMRGVDTTEYLHNLSECQGYAKGVASAAERAATGALVGAGIGLVFAAVLKDNSFAGRYAAAGALSGASGGAVGGETDQRNIIRRCMSNRGYSVLN